ncbi:hypothetical protein MYVA_1364 [Mycolicibacterium vaccae 95051]|nr:hypothetical protein MYVA_1364 [Mycolicibacterium vaccae 95051]
MTIVSWQYWFGVLSAAYLLPNGHPPARSAQPDSRPPEGQS